MTVVSVAAIAAVCLGASACSANSSAAPSSSVSSQPTTSSAPTTSSVTTTTVGYSGYVTIKGKKVGIPEEGTQPVTPLEAVGEQVIIMPKVIEPHLLFCQVGYTLTVTNLTTVTQQLRFVNDGNWRSPKIPPGGKWKYTPHNGISFYYVTNTGLQARFQASVPLPGNP